MCFIVRINCPKLNISGEGFDDLYARTIFSCEWRTAEKLGPSEVFPRIGYLSSLDCELVDKRTLLIDVDQESVGLLCSQIHLKLFC